METTPDPTALTFALIGAVTGIIGATTGILALVFQLWARRRGAHRVVVSVGRVTMLSFIGDLSADMLEVTASNLGASPVTITRWGVEMPDGGSLIGFMPLEQSTTLPHRLEAAAEARFLVLLDDVAGQAVQRGATSQQLRCWVGLAGSQVVHAKRGVPNWK